MKNILLTVIIILTHQCIYSQEGNWDVYIAQWEEGPGSVTLNMDLINSSPKSDMPFLLITGVKYKKCTEDGFPEKGEFDVLYEISDSVNLTVSKLTLSEHVGTFTHQCERLDYIYIKDTIGIRSKLEKLYSSKFKKYNYYINIKVDERWKAYREFLYPNEETLEYMSNQKIVAKLFEAGDDLSKPRQVDHWIYFRNVKDREAFVNQVKNQNFKIESMDVVKEEKFPFQLHISRKDNVDLQSICKVTLELKKIAALYNGDYDGWETFVVKDK
jgi:uncharacterized protein (TIGR01619 family)